MTKQQLLQLEHDLLSPRCGRQVAKQHDVSFWRHIDLITFGIPARRDIGKTSLDWTMKIGNAPGALRDWTVRIRNASGVLREFFGSSDFSRQIKSNDEMKIAPIVL